MAGSTGFSGTERVLFFGAMILMKIENLFSTFRKTFWNLQNHLLVLDSWLKIIWVTKVFNMKDYLQVLNL